MKKIKKKKYNEKQKMWAENLSEALLFGHRVRDRCCCFFFQRFFFIEVFLRYELFFFIRQRSLPFLRKIHCVCDFFLILKIKFRRRVSFYFFELERIFRRKKPNAPESFFFSCCLENCRRIFIAAAWVAIHSMNWLSVSCCVILSNASDHKLKNIFHSNWIYWTTEASQFIDQTIE